MHQCYEDILHRINEPPTWFDECAVPRYSKFSPDQASNIYADECALVLIACQNCGHQFDVCFSDSKSRRALERAMGRKERPRLAEAIKAKTIHYGDPPNVACCAAGPTMNCDDLRVLEYWHRPDFDWVREPSLEIIVEDETSANIVDGA